MNELHKSTLEKFQKILKLKNFATNTINIYTHYIKEMLLSFNKSAIHITAKDIKIYLESYNYTSVSQQNQIYSTVKQYSKHILNIKKLNKIILERPRKEKKLPKIIDKNYLIQQISSINNLKHKAILSIAYTCGLRVSEVLNLKIKDIDSKRMIININNAKGNKDRIVSINNNLLLILRNYYKIYKPKEYLFNGQKSLQYSSTSCNKIVKKYLGKKYHMHQLRHSYATTVLENGTDIRILQKSLGHSSVETTAIYAQVSTELLQSIKQPQIL